MEARVSLSVNGVARDVVVDTRTTLLDGLRDRLGVFSPKKGCDHGQCGSCTVLVDGRRIISCLSFAVSYEGTEIVTAEGLADATNSTPSSRRSSIRTPSSAGTARRARSVRRPACSTRPRTGTRVTPPTTSTPDTSDEPPLSDDEIRERMSGNLCRCAAYPNIVAAIRQAAGR